MRVLGKALVDKNLLQELVPLNEIPAERFQIISKNIIIEEVLKGKYLFRKGDKDNHSIYLLEGKINLIDGSNKLTGEVKSGTKESRYAIAGQQPREFSARAARKCVIARIDSGLLDVFLTCDESGGTEVVEIGADDNTDWMTRLLQTKAFKNLPPAMLQSLLIKMQPYPAEAGQVVIQQGDPGDYFYTIREGRCVVTRKDSPDSEEQHLAELDSGASFGEDALVSDAERNATVTMLTAGLLMRLSSKDFLDLLKTQLVKHVEYEQALAMVDEDAVWVDVRTKEEYETGSFEDSVNLPLSDLRNEIAELVFNTKYIICCDTGKRSELAGFLLSHKGFDVYVLEGGIPDSLFDTATLESQTSDGSTTHDVVNTDSCNRSESHNDELALLRAENEKLSKEVMGYQAAETRMKEQIKQQRDELCELGEKLELLYAQIKSKK
jgi:CRP-like cAMP-binding protein